MCIRDRANFRQYYQRPVLPQRHHINIKDFIQKNIYDETELNDDLTGTVQVPVNIKLEVEYKNYTFEAPQIHYESGTSDPFSVSHSSPATTTVTVPVSVNPDHPSQVVEEEIVDNVTIETVTSQLYSGLITLPTESSLHKLRNNPIYNSGTMHPTTCGTTSQLVIQTI